jgi:hypothetical protein
VQPEQGQPTQDAGIAVAVTAAIMRLILPVAVPVLAGGPSGGPEPAGAARDDDGQVRRAEPVTA